MGQPAGVFVFEFVIPAKAGIHGYATTTSARATGRTPSMDPDFRRDDGWSKFGGMAKVREPWVHIVASGCHGTLYTGVTSNLVQRIHQHRTGTFNGFSRRNNCHRLVWFERHETMETAIQREKRIKAWQRNWKLTLIEIINPHWSDLATGLGLSAVPQ